MADRIETAAKALYEANSNYAWEQAPLIEGGFKERALRDAKFALATSDTVLFSDEAVERAAETIYELTKKSWDDAPENAKTISRIYARTVVAALKGAGDE